MLEEGIKSPTEVNEGETEDTASLLEIEDEGREEVNISDQQTHEVISKIISFNVVINIVDIIETTDEIWDNLDTHTQTVSKEQKSNPEHIAPKEGSGLRSDENASKADSKGKASLGERLKDREVEEKEEMKGQDD